MVEKAAELLPLGPVLFLDTAGLDDITELSAKRLEKTRRILDRADAILLVTEAEAWTDFEDNLLGEAKAHKIPVIPVVNKTDLCAPSEAFLAFAPGEGRAGSWPSPARTGRAGKRPWRR